MEKIVSQQLEIISRLVAILEKGGQIPKDRILAATANLESDARNHSQNPVTTTANNHDKQTKHLETQHFGTPPVPGAMLGRDPEGNPAWYVTDPERPGKYLMVREI